MNKILIIVTFAILIGVIYGKVMFDQYDKKLEEVFSEAEIIYALQQGVYSNPDSVVQNTSKVSNYIVVQDGIYYRVYVGMTKDKENASKIEDIFIKAGNEIFVRELYVDDLSFLEVLSQYDMLLDAATKDNEILQIQKQVLSKYEELVRSND